MNEKKQKTKTKQNKWPEFILSQKRKTPTNSETLIEMKREKRRERRGKMMR